LGLTARRSWRQGHFSGELEVLGSHRWIQADPRVLAVHRFEVDRQLGLLGGVRMLGAGIDAQLRRTAGATARSHFGIMRFDSEFKRTLSGSLPDEDLACGGGP
jgi:hypothetical protein